MLTCNKAHITVMLYQKVYHVCSAVLYMQIMWKCGYELLKAQKQTVNHSHHENTVIVQLCPS